MITEYLIETEEIRNVQKDYIWDGDGLPKAYADENGNIYIVIDEYFGEIYKLLDESHLSNEIADDLHPATRKEIKAAGFWDYVINKEDYSSEEDKIETELDEYLRIGEELSKAKNSEEK